jgi:glutathione peroxidase
MKTIILIIIIAAVAAIYGFRSRWQKPTHPISEEPMEFYQLKINSLDGKPLDLRTFEGKYILCVNVASKCGYTPQYADLEKLFETYADKLVVIGFPCNQFLGQEPGNPEEIASFCSKNYGVTFPITEKIDVKGKNQHPVYQWLTSKKINGVSDADISWNFNKILISPNGKWIKHFGSSTKPLDAELTNLIQ